MAANNDALLLLVGEINGKLDTFIEQQKTADQRAIDVEVRVRKVENRQHWYSGVAAVIGLFGGGWLKSKGLSS